MSARLVLTCEHGGKRVPREYGRLFRGAAKVLSSHRGWDPGALDLARRMARRTGRRLHACTWTRLLVEPNRSTHNPRIWSEFTRDLPRAERERILERYWRPHRREVEAAFDAAVRQAGSVLHVAVHSFTPVLHGVRRNADIGLLYDPRRPAERALCERWSRCLGERAAPLRVRRNYPYRGYADGLTTYLRRGYARKGYIGVEVEVNQKHVLAGGRAWRRLREALVQSLAHTIRGEAA